MSENPSKVEKNRGQFQTGRAKTGGRQKGTLNKKTRIFLEELGNFSTVKEMINLFFSTDNDGVKMSILKELLKYEYPQRKAVEMTATLEPEQSTKEAFLSHLKKLTKVKNAD